VTRKGTSGVREIRSMMTALRASPPAHVGGDEVVAIADYEVGVRRRVGTGCAATRVGASGASAPGVTALGLPRSDVVALELASGSRVIARPSGTEPKAKFYFDVREPAAPGELAAAQSRALMTLGRIKAAFMAQLGEPGASWTS
jgi:phosphomannomutase